MVPPVSQVVGGRVTESGRLGAFITKVKKGSLADVVGHLRAGGLLDTHTHTRTHTHTYDGLYYYYFYIFEYI